MECINRNELLIAISQDVAENSTERCAQLLRVILNMPVEDVEKVTHCKDCKHTQHLLNGSGKPYELCYLGDRDGEIHLPTDFCNYGERED